MELNPLSIKIPLVPTFGRRRNRNLSSTKLSLLENYHFHNHFSPKLFSEIYLEIGFGYGEHLINKAIQNSNILFIGAETYWNGIAHLAERIKLAAINNIVIWPEDVRLLFSYLNPHYLQKIFILFPDPWPKKKHYKRRLISIPFLYQTIFFLKKKGIIFLVTDHLEYALWIEKVLKQVQGIGYTYQTSNKLDLGVTTRYQFKAKTNNYHTFIIEKLVD